MASEDGLTDVELHRALTDELVRVHAGYLGHAPRTAFTFHRGTVVVTMMHDVLTKAEKALAEAGGHIAVTEAHGLFREQMEAEFRAVVERLTGHKVLAFLGANHVDPDLAAAIFVLDEAP